MVSVQRAFVQKLSGQNASEVRKHVSVTKNTCKSVSCIPRSLYSPCDIVDPPDFEDFLLQHQSLIDADPFRSIVDFPLNDIQICIQPKKIRTNKPTVPKENPNDLCVYLRYCVEYYIRDWIIIEFCYRHHSTSSAIRDRITEREIILQEIPYRIFDIDPIPTNNNGSFSECTNSETVSTRRSVISQLSCSSDTYRSSWASFDLLNSVSDPLILSVLNSSSWYKLDELNAQKRQEQRQDALMLLYPPIDVAECIERRPHPEVPTELLGHRILVKCLSLKLELDVEPIFATFALYDCKEKKKISENFYFDMNSDDIRKLLTGHVPYSDASTECKACIFNITYPSPDLFLVVKLEKVLQGDINECIEPYIKDEKNVDKIKSNAIQFCDRLGKYRMPFCWTAVCLMNIINGKSSLDRDSVSDKDSIGSNSLDRKLSSTSFDNLRKKAGEIGFIRRDSLERKSNSDKRLSWTFEDIALNFESFQPVTLTISSFFKQEYDRLQDEDLYKFLQDLKRPCSNLKKLKSIPGNLKLDISLVTDDVPDCLTPELEFLLPCSSNNDRNCTKELLEFPAKDIYISHYSYRNLMYIYPKELNFTGRQGNARNIAVKMEVKYGENSNQNLPILFGKSSCPQFLTEVYTIVSYHSKCPYFYDEFKIQLPANIGEQHHLFFTFYHVSCQRKPESSVVETPVGYTWLPLTKEGRLRTGEFSLPVSLEYPPPNYFYITPDVPLPGIKWIDNHKSLFTFSIEVTSSIHTLDNRLDDFFSLIQIIEQGPVPVRLADTNLENELKLKLLNLSNAKLESLVKFLPIVMNKLLLLLVKPPEINGVMFNIGQVIFESVGLIVKAITTGLPVVDQDSLVGWHNILSTYIAYQCIIPHPINSCILMHQCGKSYMDTIDLLPEVDREMDFYTKGITCMCNVTSDEFQDNILSKFMRTESTRILHEELALQWVVTSGSARENAVSNSWFFFDLIIKSMVEYLASTNNLEAPRKYRFSEQFLDDIATLITTFTSDIISGYNKDIKLIQSINSSLAFFIYDLFSIADRGFVFIMLKTYYKQMSTKIATLPDAHLLYSLKLDFLRIVFSHEHFIPLNLPFGTVFSSSGRCASPALSFSSNTSRLSYISYMTTKDDKQSYAENTPDFRRHHYLIGLLFTDLTNILNMPVPVLHNKVINLVRNLMTSHDSDARYANENCKARVTALYLPLLYIVMDMLPQLHSWNNDTKGRSLLIKENDNKSAYGIQQSVAMAIAGTSLLSTKDESVDSNKLTAQSCKAGLSNEAAQNLFICFLWVLKNMNKEIIKSWWSDWSLQRMHHLLEVLNICLSRFEYKGKKAIKSANQQQYNKSLDIRSRLEDVILGQGSARSELMMRRKGGLGDRLRWRKDHLSYHSTGEITNKPKLITQNSSHVEGNLATEVSFIILDTLHLIIRIISQCKHLKCLIESVFKVLLHALSRNQSTCVLQSMFATQRLIVSKFPDLLFGGVWEHCAELCLQLLKHCSSSLSVVRSEAAASLYMLMRQSFGIGNNFARIRIQITMSLSSLVGTTNSFNEATLRRSLKTILLYSEEDKEFEHTSFPQQVKDLVFNLHMILSDTVKMKEYQEDPEMLLDLMHRIAKGYQNSPDLRVTWLNNMAQKHMEHNNHTEAAMCLVHVAALVSEYLYMLDNKPNSIVGAVSFNKISPNVLEERVVPGNAVSPKEEGFCLGKDFTLNGLVGILEHAASSFQSSGLFEAMDSVYKVIVPIIEENHDYKKLANIYGKLHEAYTKLDQLQGKRIFGTYFRVGFYGVKFGDLNEEEFVYKEPTLTKLSEIFNRLQNFYMERFGPDVVQIIKDSNAVNTQELDADKAHIQITYVEPYFDKKELSERLTSFQRNFNIRRFMYATPFTLNGRAHGELHEQYKRKTLLTVANNFPYVKTRIQVVHREQIILTPIEVALEDIQKKTGELAQSLLQDPPDTKILQMVLQGCIGTTVNQGPMEIATVFLSDSAKGNYPAHLQNKLKQCFTDFSEKCLEALKKNKNLIGPDQRDYQRELERNYHRFNEKLSPLLTED